MEHLKLFPTTVGGFTDLEIAERLMPFARKILDIDGNNSNTWNYKTSYSSTPSNINELEFFSEYTKDLGNKYLNSIGYKSLDLHCDFFFSEMFEEDLHPLHEHPNTVLSGLIYLQVPEGSSDLRFHDLRSHAIRKMLLSGMQLVEVAKISGHKTLAVLHRRYSRLQPEDLIQKINNVVLMK